MERSWRVPAHESQPILVVGLGAGGSEALPPALCSRILVADVLAGGRRHLDTLPAFAGERVAIGGDIPALVERLRGAQARGERAVVLASGDPLWYGIGATLRRFFSPDALEVVAAPTAFQLAFAALAEPWEDAALLSAHARPLDEVIAGVMAARCAAVLTDQRQTPGVVARALLAAGVAPEVRCAVCENLGTPDQRIVQSNLAGVADENAYFAALNVLVVWGGERRGGEEAERRRDGEAGTRGSEDAGRQSGAAVGELPGLPDDAFSTTGGLITKREVRLLTLAELALRPGEVLWDIGAGSGAVGIEAARAQPTAQVYAVEQRPEMGQHIRENVRRFPAPGVVLVEGSAPDACADLPAPDAVFVGGSGGRLDAILVLAQQRLKAGGRLVVNLATLENLQVARACLPQARVVQVQVHTGVPIGAMLRFEAGNPVFLVTVRV